MAEKDNSLNTLIKVIYIISISPLLAGTLLFSYWTNKLTVEAENIEVRHYGFVLIIIYLIFLILNLICSIRVLVQKRNEWIKLVLPLIISILTLPIFNIYSGYHSELSKSVYIHIINDTNEKINRIWSENFQTYHSDYDDSNDYQNFTFSFRPVDTYTYKKEANGIYIIDSSRYNKVFIEIVEKDGKIKSYKLEDLYGGQCKKIKTSEMVPRF